MAIKGYIHSTESFGSVDGPGIRFLIFMQGCHMRCRYCHNPDTWKVGSAESGSVGCGTATSVEELLDKAERYRSYWGPEGGITVSGGEAPFFPKFERLMKSTDLVLLDIKHIDAEKHRWLTGHSNEHIIDCARYLSEIEKPVWIRHVLVPGITDDEAQLKQLRQLLDTLKNIKKVEVLPYHTLGTFKWKQLGIPYTLEDVSTPTAEQVKRAQEILSL